MQAIFLFSCELPLSWMRLWICLTTIFYYIHFLLFFVLESNHVEMVYLLITWIFYPEFDWSCRCQTLVGWVHIGPWCLVGYNYFWCVKVLNLPQSLYLHVAYWPASPYFICQTTCLQACVHFLLTSAKSFLPVHSCLDGCLTDSHVIACIWNKCAGCVSFNI